MPVELPGTYVTPSGQDITGRSLTISATSPNTPFPGILPGQISGMVIGAWARPEDYSAVGDGTTDDTTALKNWVASGLALAMTPGKTYLHRQQLPFTTAGQVLDGRGATFKKAAQVVTTTATTITNNVTTAITVASVTGFVVGDRIVVEQGGVYDTTERVISTIVGSVITVAVAFQVGFAGTTNVRTSMRHVFITAADVRISNATFDGNSTNWSWGRWNHSAGVWADTGSDRGMIDHCHVLNQYGDGIAVGNQQQFWVANNAVENIKGRGVTFGGTVSPQGFGGRCIFNRLYNCDQDLNVGNTDGNGNIQISSYQTDLLIHGNVCDTGYIGIGAIDSNGNSDITITGNVIRSMTNQAINANAPANTAASRVVIANNRFYNSITVYINQQSSGSSTFPADWMIVGNLFSNTALTGNYNTHLVIESNVFQGGGTTLIYVSLANCKWTSIVGNEFRDGQYGINMGGSAMEALSVKSNTFYGQQVRPINLYTAGTTGPHAIHGNSIENNASASGYAPIVVASDKVSVKFNEIYMPNGGSSGISISGNNCVIGFNTVRAGAAANAIILQTGATNSWVKYNTSDKGITDNGTTSVVASNDTIV